LEVDGERDDPPRRMDATVIDQMIDLVLGAFGYQAFSAVR
jgi:hypothetical protein